MKIRYAAKTDVGMKRDHNEDTFGVLEEDRLFIVADGMGGHACGEVASKMAADTMCEFFKRTRDDDVTWPYKLDKRLGLLENRLSCGVKLANQLIHNEAATHVARRGMGTTVVTAAVDEGHAYIAHVGDSRAYRVRGGKILQITRDHSLLQDFMDANGGMTEEEQRMFPHRNVITRAVGMRDNVEVAVTSVDLLPLDRVLLCTDGLTGMVDDRLILDCVTRATDLQYLVADLVDRANRAGGTDNVTVVVVERTE
jgi:protein phosphatase